MDGLKMFAKSTCLGTRILFVIGVLLLMLFATGLSLDILHGGFVFFVYPLWYLAITIELSRNTFFKTTTVKLGVFLHESSIISRILFGIWLYCFILGLSFAEIEVFFVMTLFFLVPVIMLEKAINPIFEDERERKKLKKAEVKKKKELEKQRKIEVEKAQQSENIAIVQQKNKQDRTVKSKKEVLAELMSEIDEMDGHEFEHFCARLLKQNGYTKVQVTPASGDQGADVIAEKGELKYAIQCKRYNSSLNNKPIQEIGAGRAYYKCDIGVVLTNNYFNSNAVDIAKATGILLWDRKTLIKLIEDSGMLDKQ